MDICEHTKRLWELYMMGDDPESDLELISAMNDDISIIGTGKHEFYENLSSFMDALGMEGPEREAIDFSIKSVWAKEQPLSDDVKLVYGGLHVIGKGKQADVLVDMDTRYSMVYKQFGDTWKVIHIHQSLPYIDQQEGEYYPKTLLDQVEEANQRASYMEHLATTDQLTGLLNHSAFYEESTKLLEELGHGFCIIIDLDDFKMMNDTYGHQAGDAILQEMGKILRNTAGDKCVIGRIGGDEFAVFSGKISSGDEARLMIEEIMAQTESRSVGDTDTFPGLSIGISYAHHGEGLKEAFRRADEMLYEVKKVGKHGFRFCD